MALWRRPYWLVWPLGLAPLGWILYAGTTGALGADPAKELVSLLGWWGLVWLMLCLSVRPLVRVSGWSTLLPLRRHAGLLAFTWLSLHFLAWSGLLLGWDLGGIAGEIAERPYILVGFSAWLLLLPLALTSTRRARRRMGRRWQALHRLIYPAAILGVVHDLWIQKSGFAEPLVFALVLAGLFLWRWKNRPRPQSA